MENGETNSHLIVDRRFEDYEEFCDSIKGWDVDFRQLEPGKSPIELLQFGRPDFVLTRFYFEPSFEQHGSTPPDTLTFGLCEEKIDEVTTPNGVVEQDNIFCFPTNDELMAISKPQFTGYALSISETLIDEVAESYGLQKNKPSVDTMQQVVRCNHSDMTALRHALRNFIKDLAIIKSTTNSAAIIHNQEFNLIHHLLLAIAGSHQSNRLHLTNRKQRVLKQAMDYIEANSHEPITVLELAQTSGSCVRTLEYVFKDFFDITPKAYLKSRRLIAVRRELCHSLTSKTSINEIANRWGFWHMSQFAADYRRFFGELPSETFNAYYK